LVLSAGPVRSRADACVAAGLLDLVDHAGLDAAAGGGLPDTALPRGSRIEGGRRPSRSDARHHQRERDIGDGGYLGGVMPAAQHRDGGRDAGAGLPVAGR